MSGVVYGNLLFVAVGVGEIVYSMCDHSAADSALNYKLQNTNYKQIPNYNVQNYNSIKIDPTRPHALGPRPPFQLLTPNGNDILQAGEKFLIKWESDREVEKVKLEYSPDNGTTYLPIAVDVPNTGHYEWKVPHHISSNCLIRVSESKDRKMPPHGYLYEADFRVNEAEFSAAGETFSIYLGDAEDPTINQTISRISFRNETNGKSYIHLNDLIVEIGQAMAFQDKWHNIKVFMDNVYDRISVIMDGLLVFENIPKAQSPRFSPAISFAVGPNNTNDIEIDDIFVKAFYSQEDNIQWITLFNEDFERLKEKNGLGNSGWRTKGEQALGDYSKDAGKGAFVYFNPASELKTLMIQPGEGHRITVVKSFHVPIDFPFDTSDKTFEIRYNDDMNSNMTAQDQIDAYPGHGGHGTSSNHYYSSSSTTFSNSIPGRSRTADLINTYYIYTFGGKLLAEYDHNGVCVRDYIYAGNRLIAEYKPQTSEYFYYMTDQINSSRIITNDSGNVVFSEAAGPYGDVQKTWINTYDPKMKFSGKEREGYSELDYFGARYYDHKSYRFNSVDPIINKEEALVNPQLWNLYAYSRNNPITYLDPDGRKIVIAQGQDHNEIQNAVDIGKRTQSGQSLYQQLENDPRTITLRGGALGVQNNTATCGQKTGQTVSGNYIDSVEFTIDFSNIRNYHSDKSGVTTVWHELFHASAYMQSNSSTGITWVQAIGLAWRQDQPIQGGQGTGTQRGTAGQFGTTVINETVANWIINIMNSSR